MNKGQFFIITAVLLAGVLFSASSIISSAGATDYTQVVEDQSTGVIENMGEEVRSSWWNTSWLWRKSVEVEERSGLYLENESVAIDLDAKRSRVNDSCADIRVVSGGETVPWVNTTACSIDTYDSDTDAVMRYVFDRVEGGSVEDVTGNGNTGESEGNPETVSGKFGGGLNFDGSGDYIAVSGLVYDSSGEIDELTVCSWVRSTSSSQQIIASYDRSEYWRLAFKDDVNSNIGWDTTDSAGSTHDLGTSEDFTDGKWHHVCGWFDSGESPDKKIFVDGEMVESATAHLGNDLGSGTTRYGFVGVGSKASSFDGATGPDLWMEGDLDDLRIYNRSLSANQIEGIARNGIGLDVSTDLSPMEEKTLQVYYSYPFAEKPGYTGSSMTSTSMDERPVTSVGISRGKNEIVDKLRQQIEMIQGSTGASIQIIESEGCNIITLKSPRLNLRKEIC